MDVVHKMLRLAKVGPDDLVYDLGCGDGRIIVTAAQEYGACAVGIELDLIRFLWCQMLITILGLRGRVRIIYGDFFKQDLCNANVVTCYLGQRTNEALQIKFEQELQPSAQILSHNFTFPKLNLIDEDEETGIYLYNLKSETSFTRSTQRGVPK
jgi:predicted RNA methylase